jgi:putative cell wall-binding protein
VGRIRKRIVISCIALALAAGIGVPARADHVGVHVYRLGGADNIGLSVEVSKFHDPGVAYNDHEAFLARADVYADALTASAGIAIREAPLFLTSPDSLDPRVAAELERRGTSHIYILGGEQAISPAVESDLQSRGMTTERLAGATRVETALAIAESFGADRHNAIVVRGWADGPVYDKSDRKTSRVNARSGAALFIARAT